MMKNKKLGAVVLSCAALTMVSASPASAHDGGCKSVTRSGEDWAQVRLRVKVTTVWENCNTHTHPRSNSVTLYFPAGDDGYEAQSDYVNYDCVTRNDNRIASRFSGRLSVNDRIDGYPTVADQSGMHYPSSPRTHCTFQYVLVTESDETGSLTTYAL